MTKAHGIMSNVTGMAMWMSAGEATSGVAGTILT